jgi:hypothetical protein
MFWTGGRNKITTLFAIADGSFLTRALPRGKAMQIAVAQPGLFVTL